MEYNGLWRPNRDMYTQNLFNNRIHFSKIDHKSSSRTVENMSESNESEKKYKTAPNLW